MKEASEGGESGDSGDVGSGYHAGMKRPGSVMDGGPDAKRRQGTSGINLPGGIGGSVAAAGKTAVGGVAGAAGAGQLPSQDPAASRPLDKVHCDSIVNCLLRLACQVSMEVLCGVAVWGKRLKFVGLSDLFGPWAKCIMGWIFGPFRAVV